jgi:phosphopantetheinyl transferase
MNRDWGRGAVPEFETTLRLDHQTVVGIIRLASLDGLPDLEPTFLTTDEQTAGQTLRNPKRKREWLGVRAALKILLCREGIIREPHGCEIRKGAEGRPYLHFPGRPKPESHVDCSLSHKDEYALAALTTSAGIRLGADLEKISPRLVRLRSQYVNREDHLLAPPGEEVGCAVIWALKEAASKAVGLGLRTGLHNFVCLEKDDRACRIIPPQGPTLDAAYFFLDDSVGAVAWGASQAKSLGQIMEKR